MQASNLRAINVKVYPDSASGSLLACQKSFFWKTGMGSVSDANVASVALQVFHDRTYVNEIQGDGYYSDTYGILSLVWSPTP